jgi:AmmeMemoRadiSam system protein B
MTSIRYAAVAGMFYPDDPAVLHDQLQGFLADVPATGPAPKALIAPHAGYVYSGPVAAHAYARLTAARGRIRRVVLLGPSHRVGFRGLALSGADWFETPLGRIAVDHEAEATLRGLPSVQVLPRAHAEEHSLEVHLPFLQEVLGEFTLVPIVVGESTPAEVAAVLERLWGGDESATATSLSRGPRLDPIGETLVVVSTDLSHYRDYQTARAQDAATARAIENLRYEDVGYHDACGRGPLNGLLYYAREHGLRAQTLDLRNSGDTAGPRDQVVGYGAWAFG